MEIGMCEHLYVVFTLSQPVVSIVQSSQFTGENYFFNSKSPYTLASYISKVSAQNER